MRPISIRRFEWTYASRIFLAVIGLLVEAVYDRSAVSDTAVSATVRGILTGGLLLILLEAALLYMAARKAKNWARISITVLFGLSALSLPYSVKSYLNGLLTLDTFLLPVANSLLSALSVWFLFRSDSNRWFSGQFHFGDLGDTFR